MTRVLLLLALLSLSGCVERSWDATTFSCTSASGEDGAPGREVLFHFDEGYLFLQNDDGGADNVCAQHRTIACDVKVAGDRLWLEQMVEDPFCGLRPALQTTLEINRQSGTFQLTQQRCDPKDDMTISGTCEISSPR